MGWYCSNDELVEIQEVDWTRENSPYIPFDVAISGLDSSVRMIFNMGGRWEHTEYLTKKDALKLCKVITEMIANEDKFLEGLKR